MALLSTLTEAENAFETYFEYGNRYNKLLDQITGHRNLADSTTKQRMGMQLQFLAALYPRTADTNRKSRIASEITLLMNNFNNSGQFNVDKLTYSAVLDDPGHGMILLGLALVKKGSAYNGLNANTKGIVDTIAKNLFDKLGQHLYQFCLNEVNTDTTPYKYKGLNPVPKFSLNIAALVAGALSVYSDIVNKSTAHRSAIVTFSNTVVGRYGTTNNSRTFVPIGGRSTNRKPFGSSGYNAYTGMGLALAAHGHTGTGDLRIPSNGGQYLTQAKQIAAFYTSVLQSRQAYEIHEPFDFNGTQPTVTSINAVVEQMMKEPASLVTSKDTIGHATGLLNHKQPTAYLYNLAWLGDTTFLAAVDKRVVLADEAKNLDQVSAMRACMNALPNPADNAPAANRILSGFAGLLERGINQITDGK
ncbi:hypothetical protein OR571_05490 [Psychrobacillus sp. NEAU-3TGS]|uniref:hypothetical protein n=1 Tax=Psychrobacillus sp. NEAU-3TGS TaxID=2995412 RepID=UPI002495CD94|nr:hypothetical protein [Psychrobacillus sp. NEAU-3TGS]MDI2586599.1 hypothetical protein [Psychrobacillus sp. NEAU-3TGS]